jgi:hypothetical protein
MIDIVRSPDHDLERYLRSPDYDRHAAAVRQVWGDPLTMKTAGVAVFLTYLAVPVLTAVRSGRGSMARSILEGHRERTFLLRLLGLDARDGGYSEGIKNPATRRLCDSLHKQHMGFAGMTFEHLSFMAAVIALAPLQVASVYGGVYGATVQDDYWQYMAVAMALVGGRLGSRGDDRWRTDDYVTRHGGLTPETAKAVLGLRARHPIHFARCLPTLNESTCRIAVEAIGGRTCS